MKKINENELKEIFQIIKSGNQDGITTLYEKYHDLVYGICFSILRNRDNSEDVCQNVFTKLLKLDLDQFPTQGEASWLYTVTKNETIQFLRKQKSIVDIDDLYTLESESDEINDIVDMASYYKLIESLKPQDQEIISLRILSDFTFDKIAQMLNMPIGTVEWRYYKALHYIKLSISNIVAFIIVFSTYQISKNLVSNYREDYVEDHHLPENHIEYNYNEYENNISNTPHTNTSYHNSTLIFDDAEYTDVVTYGAPDTSGAAASINRIIQSVMTITTFLVSSLIIIFAIYFAFKKKIKKK